LHGQKLVLMLLCCLPLWRLLLLLLLLLLLPPPPHSQGRDGVVKCWELQQGTGFSRRVPS
jgi:hypothetical protein